MVIRRARRFVFAATLVVTIFLSVSDNARASAEDDPLLLMGILDQFEMRDTSGDNVLAWSAQGWMGKDLRKLWLKTEGERAGGDTDEAELQILYSKAIARYWDLQFGVRHDFATPIGRACQRPRRKPALRPNGKRLTEVGAYVRGDCSKFRAKGR